MRKIEHGQEGKASSIFGVDVLAGLPVGAVPRAGRGEDRRRGCVAAADLVTEMLAIKHPYDQGYNARRGIEF
ncbi:MAG: cob(I)yrinic acid a,c-diamide adenosyltransferase [Nitrospirae bacterium]|nr:cob(I)yrinic acid a,c-diamide adenosyltransferase [Nitrospirota bacterium]